MHITMMYSFLSQERILCHGTSKVWTSFLNGDLEIAHLVERFSCWRCGTFCTLNNGKTWGAVKWGTEKGCSGKNSACLGVGGLAFPKTRIPLKLWPSAASQRIDFWDETMSCGLHFVKMEETSHTDPVREMTQLSMPGTVANYFPLSEVGGCQRLHQRSLI